MNPELRTGDERRSGRTTRLADMYIQHLFNSETPNIMGSVKVVDHYWKGDINSNRKQSISLIRIIVRRLAMEHPHAKVVVDEDKLEITIKSK